MFSANLPSPPEKKEYFSLLRAFDDSAVELEKEARSHTAALSVKECDYKTALQLFNALKQSQIKYEEAFYNLLEFKLRYPKVKIMS